MKKQLIFLTIILTALNISAQYDFRKTTWGMTKDQVIKSESLELATNEEYYIAYEGSVANFPCYIYYIFAYDTLVRTNYLLMEEHSNKNDYINDWNKIKEILTDKYGKSKQDEMVWLNDLYKDDYQEWGFAVSLGYLQCWSEWNLNNKTKIVNVLNGDNYEVKHSIEYTGLEFRSLLEKYQKERRESEF